MDDLGGKPPIFGNTHIISQVSVLIIRAVAQSAFWLLLLIASSTLLGHPNDDMLMVYLNWNDNFTSLPWCHSNGVHAFFLHKLEELHKPQVKNIPRTKSHRLLLAPRTNGFNKNVLVPGFFELSFLFQPQVGNPSWTWLWGSRWCVCGCSYTYI